MMNEKYRLFQLFAIIALIIVSKPVLAVPVIQWNTTAGGQEEEWVYSVQQTPDGGYVTAGYTYSYGAGLNDAWLMKLDASGKEEWNRTFGGADYDEAISVQPTKDGGYIIAGFTRSYEIFGSESAWVIKTDAAGNEMWNRTYGGNGNYRARYINEVKDGYILAGYTSYFGLNEEGWIIKIDSSGNAKWNKRFSGFNHVLLSSAELTQDEGYILSGSAGIRGNESDALLIKIDAAGNEKWNSTFGGRGHNTANHAIQTADGGYIMAGETYFDGIVDFQAWLLKTDPDGIEQWNRTYGGIGNDGANHVVETPDEGYVMAGFTDRDITNKSRQDAWFIRTDAYGKVLWDQSIREENNSLANSIQLTADGGYVTTGVKYDIEPDAWLLKFSDSTQQGRSNNSASRSLFNISGYKINDTDGNGKWDNGETGIPGWNITLRNTSLGVDKAATTDESGLFWFLNISNGIYEVAEETRAGWSSTNFAVETVHVIDHDINNLNFTNKMNISIIKGDLNGNGRVDIADAAKVAYMVVGKLPQDMNADFNGNRRVDIGDASRISYYLVGKVSQL